MNKRTLALLAAFLTTAIYAINHTVAKGVMPTYVKPFGFIFLRVSGAAILFWLISFFGPKQKIERKDWGRMFLAALLGMCINMLAFFKGLELSTPISSSVLITISPIIVVLLSAFLIKEKVGIYRSLGILLGFLGALGLVLFGVEMRNDAPNIPMGNTLFIVNATSYGIYLIVAKVLVEKYHPLVLMKWLFTIAVVINFPLTITEFLEIDWVNMPANAYWVLVFVVLGTTFCTYLFNIFAMTELKASTVGAFIYVQPVLGILFAVATGKDTLTTVKIAGALMVLAGVYLVSRKVAVPASRRKEM